MKTKITLSLTGILVSLLTPLAVLVPQASAAAITWSGAGTSVVDSVAKTITYNVNDTANWAGGIVPGATDSWTFPANLADVDPTDAVTDDYAWTYVVNNDLTAGTDVSGIAFIGNRGSDCNVYDDRYTFGGNEISLSGDVVNSYTGTCTYNTTSRFDLPLVTTASITFDGDLYNYSVSSIASLNYGANTFSFCDVADTGRTSKSSYIYDATITGTGALTFACSNNNAQYTSNSVVGPIVVESNSFMNSNLYITGKEAGKTLTVKSGAILGLSEQGQGAAVEFKRDIIFVGAGGSTTYCTSSTCSGDNNVAVNNYRGYISNSKYNSTLKKMEYFPVTFSGDMTLSSATVLSLDTNTTITGAISGNFALSLLPGSRGSLIVESSDNQSATPNGTKAAERYDFALIDYGGYQQISNGQNGILIEAEEILFQVGVADGGILKGVGKVAGIDVQPGGTLAPGNSPGCIVSNGDLTLAGSYNVEIAGTTACTEHDQTDVTGAVDVTGGTLDVSILNNFVPKLNDTFVIIKNDAADVVTGTFTGLVEGASIVKGSVTYQITYKGGDGNDVVLTATAVPATVTTPATGIGEIMQSPIMTLLAVVLSAGMLLGIKRIQSAK